MDALIRSAALAPVRTRLSDAPARIAAVGSATQNAGQRSGATATQDTLRTEIEKQVRLELASHMQKLYESEFARARTAGRAAAEAEAKAAAAKEVENTRVGLEEKLTTAMAALQRSHESHLAKLEASVGEVAFAAVCRIAGEKAASRAFVLGMVEQTCAQLRADATANARLNPRDLEVLHDLQDREQSELRVQSLGLKLIADESIELGGCVIEAASGQYDGGLESQLRRLHAVLVGAGTPGSAVEPERE